VYARVVPLRLLARATPLVLGAVAVAIWLRRRKAQRRLLTERTQPVAAPTPPPRPPTGRFERRPIDIVTVVDDLLGAVG
jgi:hypothetical protein